MNKPQRIILSAVVPVVVLVFVWFLNDGEARESWWVWMLAIVAVGVYEWLLWAEPEKRWGWWRAIVRWVQGPPTPPE